jgi:hypothetical protein
MKAASVVASRTIAVLYAKCRNRIGLQAPALPFKHLDMGQPASVLGEKVLEVLAASSLPPGKNKHYVDRTGQVLKMTGLPSWSKAAICSIDDEDDGMLRFQPKRPDGVGHEGRPSDEIAIPLDSPPEAIGNALIKALKQARIFARLD